MVAGSWDDNTEALPHTYQVDANNDCCSGWSDCGMIDCGGLAGCCMLQE
ncbi:hypothetical protein [Candidatus Tisiphia endosymbiont of Nemotelus uliginosus]